MHENEKLEIKELTKFGPNIFPLTWAELNKPLLTFYFEFSF